MILRLVLKIYEASLSEVILPLMTVKCGGRPLARKEHTIFRVLHFGTVTRIFRFTFSSLNQSTLRDAKRRIIFQLEERHAGIFVREIVLQQSSVPLLKNF